MAAVVAALVDVVALLFWTSHGLMICYMFKLQFYLFLVLLFEFFLSRIYFSPLLPGTTVCV